MGRREPYGIEPATPEDVEELREWLQTRHLKRPHLRVFGPEGKRVYDDSPLSTSIPRGHTGFARLRLICDDGERRRGLVFARNLLERVPNVGVDPKDVQLVFFQVDHYATRARMHRRCGATVLFSDHVQLKKELKDLVYSCAKRARISGYGLKIGYLSLRDYHGVWVDRGDLLDDDRFLALLGRYR